MPTALTPTGINFPDGTSQTTAVVNPNANVNSVNGSTGAVTVNSIGESGQTWQNVLSSRAKGTTYTNTTGRPICVAIGWVNGSPGYAYYNGSTFAEAGGSYAQRSQTFMYILPGDTYSVSTSMGVDYWAELR